MRRRRTFDDHGRPIVEVESDTGMFRQEIDTVRIRQLRGDVLSLAEVPSDVPPGVGPDPRAGTAGETGGARLRSGLDRLRALSEAIKRQRARDPGGSREGEAGN